VSFNIGTISTSTSELSNASAATTNDPIHWLNARVGFCMSNNWPADKVNISATEVLMGENCTVLPGYIFSGFVR
jgi:hypothetical protein